MTPRPLNLLSLKEAANLAGLSATTLRVQIFNKKLQAVKLGRDWWVTRKDLLAYTKHISRKAK